MDERQQADPSWVPVGECVAGGIYLLSSRNLALGAYDDERRGFIGIRTKFSSRYLFTEYHWDTGAPFGTARPIRLLGHVSDGVRLWERFPQSWCRNCGERVAFRQLDPPADNPLAIRGVWEHHYTDLDAPDCGDPSAAGGRAYWPLFSLLERYEQDMNDEQDVQDPTTGGGAAGS